jgi:hypothetical protein
VFTPFLISLQWSGSLLALWLFYAAPAVLYVSLIRGKMWSLTIGIGLLVLNVAGIVWWSRTTPDPQAPTVLAAAPMLQFLVVFGACLLYYLKLSVERYEAMNQGPRN